MDSRKKALFLVTAATNEKIDKILDQSEIQDKLQVVVTVNPADFYYWIFGSDLIFEVIVIEQHSDLEIDKIRQSLFRQRIRSRIHTIPPMGSDNARYEASDDLRLRRLLRDIIHADYPVQHGRFKRRSNTLSVPNAELANIHNSYKNILNCAGEGIVGLDGNGVITFANPMAGKILGEPVKRLIGMRFQQFAQDSPLELGSSNQSFMNDQDSLARVGRGVIRRSDGGTIVVEYTHSQINLEDADSVSVMVIEDITERVKFESALTNMATYDRLTGLYNRLFFEFAFKSEISSVRSEKKHLSQCLIDLDGFKLINDQYGHAVGDAVLIEVAQRLKESVRRDDMVARLGGDEFVILFKNADHAQVQVIAEHIIEVINVPIIVDDLHLRIGCSLGIYLLDGNEESIQEVLKKSDEAMYAVKNRGKNGIEIYQASDRLNIGQC